MENGIHRMPNLGERHRFHVSIEMGDGKTSPSKEAVNEFNQVLKKVKGDFQLR